MRTVLPACVRIVTGLLLAMSAVPALAQVVRTEPVIIVPQVFRVRPMPTASIVLTGIDAAVTVDDQVASTVLELTFTNPGGVQQEAVVLLPVPDGVAVRSLQYDGVGPEPTAQVLTKEEARRIYDGIVRQMRDPALVEFAGYNLIKTSAFPIPPGKSQKLSLTYEQVLTMDGDRVDYVLPRSEALAGGAPMTIAATIRSKRPIASLYSPSHEIVTQRVSPGHVRVTLLRTSTPQPGSVRFSYMLERGGELSASTLAYPDASVGGGNGGFFMLLASPPAPRGDAVKSVKREVVLVLDRSGSMKGEKMKQAQAAAAQIIEGLEEGEAFNIIDYSDSVASFAPQPVIKTRESADRAKAYIAGLDANGGTNINDALAEALRSKPTEGMLPMVLFLTDGLPTVGERSEVAIREAAKKANTGERRIFSFGVGFDVNTPLLAALSKSSRGAATFVLPDEDVEVKVSQVFRRLAGPVLASPRLTVVGAHGEADATAVREMLPSELPDLFEGDQVVLTGKYTGTAPVVLRVEGEYFGAPRRFEIPLDVAQASVRNSFIPRIWANRKVGVLVDAIRQAGADPAANTNSAAMKELVDEIIALSTKYGILTEYTSFLATESKMRSFSGQSLDEARKDVRSNLESRAMRERSGAGGAVQQMNIKAQAAAPASVGNYAFKQEAADGRIEDVTITTVQNVADRTFFQRNNRWVDSQLLSTEAEKPDRTIEFGSDEYMTLARDLARENRQVALALGGDVLLQVGKERVLVKGP